MYQFRCTSIFGLPRIIPARARYASVFGPRGQLTLAYLHPPLQRIWSSIHYRYYEGSKFVKTWNYYIIHSTLVLKKLMSEHGHWRQTRKLMSLLRTRRGTQKSVSAKVSFLMWYLNGKNNGMLWTLNPAKPSQIRPNLAKFGQTQPNLAQLSPI